MIKLDSGQKKFLSSYLHRALIIDRINNNAVDVVINNPTRDQIYRDLGKIETREALYEYLEDFSFINDPMFDLLLNVLI